ncbi:MAG: hypothetical protein ACK5LO_11320 [Leucobacter sp.]
MSYRYAIGTYGRPVTRVQRRLVYAVCACAGVSSALIVCYALGWEVLPPWIAAVTTTAAILLGAIYASKNRPVAEIYYPRSDGLWQQVMGGRVVDARYMAGGPPPGRLELGYRGGFAAATVYRKRRSGRYTASEELYDVTLLVAAPGRQPYLTRVLMHLQPGDAERIWPGRVLLAARFSSVEPDIALLPEGFLRDSRGEDRERAEAALAAALTLRDAARLPLRDSRTYRLITRGYNQFWTLFYERPNMVWQDVRDRGDWLRYLKMIGVFAAAFVGTSLFALLLLVLRLLVPWLDGSGPAAYN